MQVQNACYAIIAAAGAGRRMDSDTPKQFLPLEGIPVWLRTLAVFRAASCIKGVVVVIPAGYLELCREALTAAGVTDWPTLIEGGTDRAESVYKALCALPTDAGVVLVHDAVRPFVTAAQIEAVAQNAAAHEAAVLAVPVKDTVKVADEENRVLHTPARDDLWLAQTPQGFYKELLLHPARDGLWLAQTPQGFHTKLLLSAYEKAALDGFIGTDDASYVERLGVWPAIVQGDYKNIKLTTPDDLLWAAFFLKYRQSPDCTQ